MDLVCIPDNPIPNGVFVGDVRALDGIKLRFARWMTDKQPALGTIMVLQGRAEFIEKYFEVIDDLLKRGLNVVTFDWRGQGRSERLLQDRRKGHVADFKDFEQDLTAVIEQVMLPDCPPPYFLMGHSMGGHIALRFAPRARTRFERMVLVAPFIALPCKRQGLSPRIICQLACVLKRLGLGHQYVPGGGATAAGTAPFAGNLVTSDVFRYQRTVKIIEAAPDLAIGSPTIGWLDAACRSCALLARPEFPETVGVPSLFAVAGSDRVVSVPAIEEMSNAIKVGSHIVIDYARHEILMERDMYRDPFFAAFDAFIPGTRPY